MSSLKSYTPNYRSLKQSLRVGKTILAEGLEIPTYEEFEKIVLLASSEVPIDQLWSHLQVDKKRLVKVEKLTTKELTKQYKDMMDRLRYELTALRKQVLGASPSISEMVEFVQSVEILRVIEQRVKELEPYVADIVTGGIVDAGWLGAESFVKDVEIMAKTHQITPEMLERARQLSTPNLAAAEVTIPLAVGDTRRISTHLINRIAERLREGAIQGNSFSQMIQTLAIEEGVAVNRAELISRWSVIKGYNEERLARFKQAKLPRIAKMWMANLDGRVCGHCLALHGSVMKMGEEFDGQRTFARKPMNVYMGLDTPPRHPRCRCSVVPWREDWRDGATITPESMFASATAHANSLDKEYLEGEIDGYKRNPMYSNVNKVKPPKPVYRPFKRT